MNETSNKIITAMDQLKKLPMGSKLYREGMGQIMMLIGVGGENLIGFPTERLEELQDMIATHVEWCINGW